MSITTRAGVFAGLQQPQSVVKVSNGSALSGVPVSMWSFTGMPAPGSYNTTLNGAIYSSSSGLVTGQIPHFDPAGGQNSYLARFEGQSIGGGFPVQLVLVDRLWDNGGITITSTAAQSITSPTWPARDVNGNTAGVQVMLGLEVSAATGAGTPSITVSYTNTTGVSGRTGTNIETTVTASPKGTFYRLGLQSGDRGVTSVQSLTLGSSWTSGTINLVAYRLLTVLSCSGGGFSSVVDDVTGGFPTIWNGSVPFLLAVPSTTGGAFGFCSCQYVEAQG